MKDRVQIWNRLNTDTKDFVLNYLQKSLNIEKGAVDNFLFPEYSSTLLDGRAMHDMDRAVSRTLKAITSFEKICVYGDYDCDGVPGTALLRDFFEKINYRNVIYYIPHRHTEGYGLNNLAIENFSKDGVSLIITIDLGTTNIQEIDRANELEIDVIVTDHHLPLENEEGQILPNAHAIINNKKRICNYSNKDLCGSGTIFKLVTSVLETMREIYSGEVKFGISKSQLENAKIYLPQNGYEKWLLDLVAVATIADMVPLTNENRTLAIYGLHVLSKTNRPGLQTLFSNAKTNISNVTETDIAFTVAPRINSASRMAHPKIALSMFSQNLEEGINAAHELEELNISRKETTNNIIKKIYKILDERIEVSTENKLPEVLVIGDKSWNPGILGILASKILDKYNVNVFVFGGNDEDDPKVMKGSCRSRGDVHLVKLMTSVKEIFDHFGGHELAGGFSISFDKVHNLEKVLNHNIEHSRIENVSEQKQAHQKNNFKELHISNINRELLDALKLIGPFGVGNPKPYFKILGIERSEFLRFGKNKEHLKIILIGRNLHDRLVKLEAIKFFVEKSEQEKIENLHSKNDLLFEVEPGWMSAAPRLKIII